MFEGMTIFINNGEEPGGRRCPYCHQAISGAGRDFAEYLKNDRQTVERMTKRKVLCWLL